MISNSKFVEILPSLQEACIKAGELQKKYHKTDIDIATKSNKTPVTVSYTHLTLPTKA